MTPPQTATEVAQFLAGLARRLQEKVDEIATADRQATFAKENYIKAYATAYRKCQGTAESRKQDALLLTSDERLASEEADCRVRDLRRQIDAIKVRIDVGRSYGSAIKSELAIIATGLDP